MKYSKKVVGEGREFERIRRITGYLTGTLDGWNSAKRAEEKDRFKHPVKTDKKE
jgi:ribonucleoside-triphosphate reductase|nr:anaerobic ribonucleoside-triphosphate reductase [Acutalibacter muris]